VGLFSLYLLLFSLHYLSFSFHFKVFISWFWQSLRYKSRLLHHSYLERTILFARCGSIVKCVTICIVPFDGTYTISIVEQFSIGNKLLILNHRVTRWSSLGNKHSLRLRVSLVTKWNPSKALEGTSLLLVVGNWNLKGLINTLNCIMTSRLFHGLLGYLDWVLVKWQLASAQVL